jgi:hypothetical protein
MARKTSPKKLKIATSKLLKNRELYQVRFEMKQTDQITY